KTLSYMQKIWHKILTDKARLYRTRRSSSSLMGYAICEYRRIVRTRKAKE
ncbi:4182_t:CDS:1, partial [Racocetra persica]